jgi:hypothetical protein
MPRCSVCNKYSMFGFANGTVKPVHVKCLKKEVIRKAYTPSYPYSRPTRRHEEEPSSSLTNLIMLNSLLESSHDHDRHCESTPVPFEGKGGEFGGAGATGSWDSPSSNDTPPSDSSSDSSSSSDSGSSSSDSGSSGGSDF